MTVRVYKSTDTGAPQILGSRAGDLINLLDKCLVTGYGSKLPAGWTKPFVGTNRAAFKQGAGSNGMYLRVDDTSAVATYRMAKVKGFTSMTDVNTGRGQFPTEGQYAGGLNWMLFQSGTASYARNWILVADEKLFYLSIETAPEDSSTQIGDYYREFMYFGDINKYGTTDESATVLWGHQDTTFNTYHNVPFDSSTLDASYPGLFLARSFSNLGGSRPAGQHHDYYKAGGYSTWGAPGSYLSYPHGPDGGLIFSPIWVHEPGTAGGAHIRGTLPGLWAPLQNVFAHGDTFEGQGELAGRTFLVFKHYQCRCALEISNTWR